MSAENFLNSFLAQTNETAELNTEYFICPELEEAPATVSDYQLKSGMSKGKDGESERPWVALTLQWDINSPEAREATQRDTVKVYGQPVFLAITEQGQLDPVNNQALGRLYKLFGIDVSGLTIKEMLDCLKGQYASVKVKHRALINKDKEPLLDDEGNQRYSAEVVAVGAA